MAAEQFIIKADIVEDADGVLTTLGMKVATQYARDWLAGQRNLELEGQYPELEGLFYDLRIDPALTRRYAAPDDLEKAELELEASLEKAFQTKVPVTFILTETVTETDLEKAGAHKYVRRFKGKGGKWVYVYRDKGTSSRGRMRDIGPAAKRKKTTEAVRYEGATVTAAEPWHPAGTPLKRHWVDRIPGEPMGLAAPGGDDGGTFAKWGGDPETGKVSNPERAKLHDDIMGSFLDKIPPVPPGQQKLAVVMMGGPASGKSTATQHMGLDDFVQVDPDAVKSQIPEMQKGLNLGTASDGSIITAKSTAAAVHVESSHIASRIKDAAIEQNKHVLVDGTGSYLEGHIATIQKLKAQGYQVHLVMAHQKAEIAHELNKGRATTSGRFVPKAVVDGAYQKIPKNFQALAELADEATVYDATRGHPPKHVWSMQKGPPPKDEHHDPEFVSSFKTQHFR